MNRSAQDRERLSPHYGGESVMVPLYRTKVFADDTTKKITEVTLGELLAFREKDKPPYKHNEMGSKASGVVGRLNSSPSDMINCNLLKNRSLKSDVPYVVYFGTIMLFISAYVYISIA